MCRTATVETLAQLAASYNPHFCTVSTEEGPETLKNLTKSCLCLLHNSTVKVNIMKFVAQLQSIHKQQCFGLNVRSLVMSGESQR